MVDNLTSKYVIIDKCDAGCQQDRDCWFFFKSRLGSLRSKLSAAGRRACLSVQVLLMGSSLTSTVSPTIAMLGVSKTVDLNSDQGRGRKDSSYLRVVACVSWFKLY